MLSLPFESNSVVAGNQGSLGFVKVMESVFEAAIQVETDSLSTSVSVAFGDFDGDGLLDLNFANFYGVLNE